MGVSSVTLFREKFGAEFLVFVGVLAGFLGSFSSLTRFGPIPHTFQWKNVTFFAHFV